MRGGAMPYEVKRADELLDRFKAKREIRQQLDPLGRAVLGSILRQLVATGGPVSLDVFPALFPGHDAARVREAIARLDETDLILVQEGRVTLAYPLSGIRTAFGVVLPDGRERYAVCAIDALGVAAMLGEAVTIRSRCHHCGEPLEIDARPDEPVGGGEIMVWVGERGDAAQRSCTSVCLTLNFFRSEEHLRSWREVHPEVPGAAVVLTEALKIGATIFGDLLRDRDLGARGRALGLQEGQASALPRL